MAFPLTSGPDPGAQFGSPVESIVSSAAWEASPRGRGTLPRRTLPIDLEQRTCKIAEITAQDACLGGAVAAEAARFAGCDRRAVERIRQPAKPDC